MSLILAHGIVMLSSNFTMASASHSNSLRTHLSLKVTSGTIAFGRCWKEESRLSFTEGTIV